MDIINTIQNQLYESLLKLGIKNIDRKSIHIEPTSDSSHGNYACNVAMQLSKELGQAPRTLAEGIVSNLEKSKDIERIEVAGPGFINFYLSNEYLWNGVEEILENPDKYFQLNEKKGEKIMIEYTDPNPFKILHVGHLYTNIVGESFARLQEALGADVKRAIYQGDVGLHVAKTLWGLEKKLKEEKLDFNDLEKENLNSRVKYLGDAYILGSHYYDELKDPVACESVDNLNYYISSLFVPQLAKKDFREYEKENIKEKYLKGRKWCLDYFETIYKKLGTKFDYYFLESETSPVGYSLVKENIGNIFKEDKGAVVYEGDKNKGLHTRVFINHFGIPTYEAKDLGLAVMKRDLMDYDESIYITGKEQAGYFQVMFDALSKINKEMSEKSRHIPHGLIKSADGKKLSSRKGTAGAEELIESTTQKAKDMILEGNRNKEDIDERSERIAIAAIKYAFLKVGVGNDIVFDSTKALSFDGDTGPYLLYTYARCSSIIENAKKNRGVNAIEIAGVLNNSTTKELVEEIIKYDDIVLMSAKSYAPSILTQYLFDLCQLFSTFYQTVNVLNSPEEEKEALLKIVNAVMLVLRNGLYLLGISVVDEM